MGLGLFGGGAAVARYLSRAGARVTVTDQRTATELAPALSDLSGLDLRFVLGEHRQEDFTGAGLVIANPAVSPHSPYLEAARSAGVPVSSEMALFLQLCPARIAAVTGTQGKSSTCNTLAQLLEAAGYRVHLGGNIGRSLLESCTSMAPEDIVVLELSSYQLEALPRSWGAASQRPRVETVGVTNVLADHIERHGSLESYAAAKRRILELVGAAEGTAVLSAEDPRTATWREVRRLDFYPTREFDRGLNIQDGWFRLDQQVLGHCADLLLSGAFQRENTLMALGLARLLGAAIEPMSRALPALQGLPHRLEDLGVFGGHRVWDNGVSTTPDSTLSVLHSIGAGCTLICGGKAKNLPLDQLLETARKRVRRAIVFGSAAEHFGSAFRSVGIEACTVRTVEEAIQVAFERMQPGEELLFSPACASFDQYLNFKERALAFRRGLPFAAAPAETVRS